MREKLENLTPRERRTLAAVGEFARRQHRRIRGPAEDPEPRDIVADAHKGRESQRCTRTKLPISEPLKGGI